MDVSSVAPEAPADSSRWSRITERGSTWGLRFTVWCFRVLGRGPVLALVPFIVGYFFLTDRRGRRASTAYLRRVRATPAGRATLGAGPMSWQSFLRYWAFGLAIVDRLAIWFDRAGDFEYEVQGSEHFDRLASQGRGAIVLGAHLGSFDALRLLAERRETVVNVLMFTTHAPRINAVFRDLSPDAEARVIRVRPNSVHAVFAIRSCLDRGELVAILGDRVEPGDRRRTSRVPFLGDAVELPQAPFLLAHLLGCPVMLMLALRAGGGRYRVHAERLAERVRLPRERAEREKRVTELLTAYAARLEDYCARFPHQWFNFFDYWGDEESS